jgi:hypothetical protein
MPVEWCDDLHTFISFSQVKELKSSLLMPMAFAEASLMIVPLMAVPQYSLPAALARVARPSPYANPDANEARQRLRRFIVGSRNYMYVYYMMPVAAIAVTLPGNERFLFSAIPPYPSRAMPIIVPHLGVTGSDGGRLGEIDKKSYSMLS